MGMREAALLRCARLIKPLAKALWLRPGTVHTIFAGPCKGMRYRIFPDMGLAPLYGGWEIQAQRAIAAVVASGGVVFDVGANYGIHAFLFARLVSERGRVFAFEPSATISADLRANLDLNRLSNVTVVQKAVAASSGTVHFLTGEHVGAGRVVAADQEGTDSVESISLDALVTSGHAPAPTFVKIDVEGGEGAVLAGAKEILRNARPTLLIDLHNPEQDRIVGGHLTEANYTAARIDPWQQIRDLSSPWPAPDGIWGQIIAVPLERSSDLTSVQVALAGE